MQDNSIAQKNRLNLPDGGLEYGALGRNTGEVLSVFGEIIVTPPPAAAGPLVH